MDKNTNNFVRLEEVPSYVMAKDLLRKFVSISDIKLSIFGFLFGKTVDLDDDNIVKEVHCIALMP